MPTPRQLTYALLLASTVTHAAPRTDLSSLSFSHKDWELACDNTRTCRAAGYHPEDDEPNASLLVTRTAGPNQPVSIQLQLADDERHPVPGQVTMTVARQNVGIVRIDPNSNTGTLSQAQVGTLLPALLKDAPVAWTANGTTWTISTAGANAVLLKMDEFQGRLETPGALVRKGNKPEGNVLPAVEPSDITPGPVLHGQRPIALTRAQQRDLSAALRKTVADGSCELLDAKSDEAGPLEVQRLTKDKLLVSHACWHAAYNTGDGYWVVNAQPPYAPVLVTTSATDYDNGVISSTQKGRGIADCLGTASWTWDGHAFVQTAEATTGMCRQFPGGAWNLPTLVTRIHK
jgi:hypothetical protein